jgi:hypothetical protein
MNAVSPKRGFDIADPLDKSEGRKEVFRDSDERQEATPTRNAAR